MKKLTFLFVFLLAALALSACAGQPTPIAQPTQAIPAPTQPPATAEPTEPPLPTPVPTLPALTQASTAVTETGEPVIILSTHMTSVNEGWAVGEMAEGTLQRILRTADGGQTWSDVTPPDQLAKRGNTDTSVLPAYQGEDHAWAIYFAPIPASASEAIFVWHTADRGQTWQAGEPVATSGLPMEFFIPGELGFSDPQNGWLMAHLGAGMNHDYVAVFKTTDGGQTWVLTAGPENTGDTALPMVCSKTGLTFRDQQNGWASGNCHGVMAETFLYRTQDGGANWQLVDLPAPSGQPNLLKSDETFCGTLPPIFFDDQNGALTVECRTSGSEVTRLVYVTTDGGQNWQPEERGVTGWDKIDFARSGDHWVLQPAPSSEVQPGLFAPLFNQPGSPPVLDLAAEQSGLDFVDSQHGWASVTLDAQPRLLATSDGGRTWQDLQPRLLP